jgi:hypothetical protein
MIKTLEPGDVCACGRTMWVLVNGIGQVGVVCWGHVEPLTRAKAPLPVPERALPRLCKCGAPLPKRRLACRACSPTRRYQARECAQCHAVFTPTGARGALCQSCQ